MSLEDDPTEQTEPLPVRDIANAIRPALFQTELEEWRYATDGGTVFIVRYEGQMFGVSCKHVFVNFSPRDLFIGNNPIYENGSPPAQVGGMTSPVNPGGGAIDSDILDLLVLWFADDVTEQFFGENAYFIGPGSVVQSRKGDMLRVCGALKEHTVISPPNIEVGYCDLMFMDRGESKGDPAQRIAQGKWIQSDVKCVIGLSGSPVFNLTQNALCGMVVRGGFDADAVCTIRYLDIYDMIQYIDAIAKKKKSVTYEKVPEH